MIDSLNSKLSSTLEVLKRAQTSSSNGKDEVNEMTLKELEVILMNQDLEAELKRERKRCEKEWKGYAGCSVH